MTPLQRLQIRQSELRQSINQLLAVDGDLSSEQQQQLERETREVQELEPKLRAALAVGGDDDSDDDGDSDSGDDSGDSGDDSGDSEEQEIDAIADRSSIASYIGAAMAGRPVEGAEAELNAALGLDRHDGHMPLRALDPGQPQERVDAATTLGTADAPATGGRWLQRVFFQSVARWLGVTFESVPVGERVHTEISGGTAGATVARGTTQDATAATLNTVVMEPHRLSARYLFEVEDAGRLMQLEPRLRQDLSMVLSDAMDQQIMQGNSNLSTNGLQAIGTSHEQSIASWSSGTAATILAEILNLIDGKYCSMLEEARVAWLPVAYSHIHSLANSNVRQFLYQSLMGYGLMQRASGHVQSSASIAAGSIYAIGSKRRGIEGSAVAAVWPSMQLIRDPYTAAADGRIALTAIMLWDFAVIREENWLLFKATAA